MKEKDGHLVGFPKAAAAVISLSKMITLIAHPKTQHFPRISRFELTLKNSLQPFSYCLGSHPGDMLVCGSHASLDRYAKPKKSE